MGQVTVRQTASDEHPAVPAITVARITECVTKHGRQLEPQEHRLYPTVKVDRDGVTWGVTADDIPASADDFAFCVRTALNDMAIPHWITQLPPMEATGAQRLYMGSPALVVVVVVGLSELVLEAGAYTFLFAVTVKVVDKAVDDVTDALKETRNWKDMCRDEYEKCMDTVVGDKDGNHWQESRCGTCAKVCILNKGAWPSQIGNGSCEYWQRGWK